MRIGILGAAAIAPAAIVEPASVRDDVEVVTVAAREPDRARAFAAQYRIPTVDPDYQAMLSRVDVDAVYIALPSALHHEWASRALRAGKHVLCEKPMTTSAAQARDLVEIAADRGLVVAQALHYRYHPLMQRVLQLAHTSLGDLRTVQAVFRNAIPRHLSVYWQPTLGGTSMHNGCYAVHALRSVVGTEFEVTSAQARWLDGTDAAVTADVLFANDVSGRIESSIVQHGPPQIRLDVVGTHGRLRADNFVLPHLGAETGLRRGSVTVASADGAHVERFPVTPTYRYQLDAFIHAVAGTATMPTAGHDIVATAPAIEAVIAASRPL